MKAFGDFKNEQNEMKSRLKSIMLFNMQKYIYILKVYSVR